jgi:hypothetical protein
MTTRAFVGPELMISASTSSLKSGRFAPGPAIRQRHRCDSIAFEGHGEAQGFCRDPGAWRQFSPGGVQYRKPSRPIPPRPHCQGTVVHADEAASWDNLHERFEVKRINHQEAYSLDGACTNMAVEYFSRLRHSEIGIHHRIAGAYVLRYAQESRHGGKITAACPTGIR